MIEHRMIAGEAEPSDDMRRLCLGLHALKLNAVASVAYFDALEHSEEIEMPPGAAVFSVCDTFEPDRLFLGDQLRDFAVLDLLQLGRVYRSGFPLGAGFLNRGRAQDTDDVIGAERRAIAQ